MRVKGKLPSASVVKGKEVKKDGERKNNEHKAITHEGKSEGLKRRRWRFNMRFTLFPLERRCFLSNRLYVMLVDTLVYRRGIEHSPRRPTTVNTKMLVRAPLSHRTRHQHRHRCQHLHSSRSMLFRRKKKKIWLKRQHVSYYIYTFKNSWIRKIWRPTFDSAVLLQENIVFPTYSISFSLWRNILFQSNTVPYWIT
mgnify:CR=1 FL=1